MRDSRYTRQRMLDVELPNRRKRRPQRKFMNVVKADMQRVGVTEMRAVFHLFSYRLCLTLTVITEESINFCNKCNTWNMFEC